MDIKFSDDLRKRISERAAIIGVDFLFLLSAIQTIAIDKVMGIERTEADLQKEIILNYYGVVSLWVGQQPGADKREVTAAGYEYIRQNDNVAEILAHISGDDTIKNYHITAASEGIKIAGEYLKKYPRFAYAVQQTCTNEITQASLEIKEQQNRAAS